VRTIHGRCRVLGEGGLGAYLAERLYVGEVVRLDVPPVAGLYASVRNTKGSEHGFEFMFTRDDQRRQIRALCAWCSKDKDS
jgi:PilZ domain